MPPSGKRAEPAPVETELKLGLTAEAADALLGSTLLREHARGPARTRELRSVYYDTPDRRLRGRLATLRVREVEDRHVQTLKSARRGDGAAICAQCCRGGARRAACGSRRGQDVRS